MSIMSIVHSALRNGVLRNLLKERPCHSGCPLSVCTLAALRNHLINLSHLTRAFIVVYLNIVFT